jgi:LysM repeat protein
MRGGARLLIVGLSITVAGTLAACGGSAATPLPTLPPETPTPEVPAVVETLPPTESVAPDVTTEPEATDEPAATTKKYRVKKGDTMIGIAAKFGITLKALQKANPKVKPRELKVGQTLIIPAQ